MFSRRKKLYSQVIFILTTAALLVFLTSCGPAPNPKLVGQSEQTKEKPKVQEPSSSPVVEEARPIAPAEAPRPQPAAKPKQQTVARQVSARPAAPVRPVNDRAPSSASAAPAPARETASTAPATPTLTLPAPAAPPTAPPPPPPTDEIKAEPVAPPPPRQIKVPSGTIVAVRMIDSVDSETAHVGETFKASLDEPIVVDDETVFPKGSEVYVKLAKVQAAGRVSGRSEVQLQLDRIFLGRKSYLVESNTYTNTGASQGSKTARSAGIGAAVGAAIGAISGGGKGAVIGGATGAGAGAGVEAIRKGEQVRVNSETRLDFRLENSLEVTLDSPSSANPQRHNPSEPRFGTRQR
jgi:hypothetical protein